MTPPRTLTPEDICDTVLSHAGECRCNRGDKFECTGCLLVRLVREYGKQERASALAEFAEARK